MIAVRRATVADAGLLAATVIGGMATYRSFAPPGWSPPDEDLERARIAEVLAFPETWCLLAADDGAPAGHATFLPAERTRMPTGDPGLAHLMHLFLREPWWGSGLAKTLHDAAVAEATARGFRRMRLGTPAAHARARRFYEREGWRREGEPIADSGLGVELVEYFRAL